MKQLVQTRNLRCQKQFEQYRQWTYNVMLRRAFVQPLLQWNSETHYTNCVCVFERFFFAIFPLTLWFLCVFNNFSYLLHICFYVFNVFFMKISHFLLCVLSFLQKIFIFFLLFYHIYQMHDFMLFD